MSPKHVFKTNEKKNNLYCHKVMRVLLLKREKKDRRSPIFWLYILACILCCFVCFNKHTRTRVQKLQIVLQIHVSANSLFKLPSNLRLLVEENGL